ncbi:MAG: DUF4422 domain-containing protein [Oscillospiraceae bacterium]|jgi:hypothetical protein|nr:DUF4422 domain-containing protein [Oscillospiraceae bacterium]
MIFNKKTIILKRLILVGILTVFLLSLYLLQLQPNKSKQKSTAHEEPFVKILIGYHKKPKTLIKGEVFVPIHLGRDVNLDEPFHTGINLTQSKPNPKDHQWLQNNMIGDNTGDNISKFNRQYCEITGVYWALKNLDKLGNPKYIGNFHYRRQLNFKNEKNFVDEVKFFNGTADEKYRKEIGLDEETIKNTIKNYDIILPRPFNFEEGVNLYTHTKIYHPIESLDICFDSIKKRHPEYSESVDIAKDLKSAYFSNLWIMKKEIFEKLCALAFDSLEDVRKTLNPQKCNTDAICAYVFERLFNVFIVKEKLEKNHTMLELEKTWLTDP